MAKLRLGKPDVSPDAPAHTPGIKQGNALGNYESRPGTCPTGAATARALDRHQRGQARSRSTRGCRTSRPA